MRRALLITLRRAIVDRGGVTAAEYAILGLGIIIAVAAGAATFGTALGNAFNEVGAVMASLNASGS